MLYQVMPDRSMVWINMPDRVVDAAAEVGVDLAMLEWEPSESRATDAIVGMALRYGVTCRGGIAVGGRHVAVLLRPSQIVETHAQAQEGRAKLGRENALMEPLFPGPEEGRRALDAAVDEGVRIAIERAEADAAKLLDTRAPDQELVAHWRALGGELPNASG